MPRYDLRNTIDIEQSLAPAARTASANGAGVEIGDFESVVVEFTAGEITDGTHTPSVEVSPDGSDWSAAATTELQGSLVALTDNSVQRVGVIGSGLHVRAVVTVSGASTGGVYGANVIKGHPGTGPVA